LAWTVELSWGAEKALKKLDRQTSRRIGEFIDLRLNGAEDPRVVGKPLQASLREFWAYRVGDHRLICELKDNVLVILVVEIGHRSAVYR
jgi:mRNA interferase RelE/StbE